MLPRQQQQQQQQEASQGPMMRQSRCHPPTRRKTPWGRVWMNPALTVRATQTVAVLDSLVTLGMPVLMVVLR